MIIKTLKTSFIILLLFCIHITLVSCQTGSVTSSSSGSSTINKGDLYVDVYDATKACNGTTIFADLHDTNNPRIVEVNMEGKVIWEYKVPDDLKKYYNPGFDVKLVSPELGSNSNVLFVLPRKGVYEIDRSGNIVWSYLDSKVSHNADRLKNGNTLVAWGGNDAKGDDQAKEVDPNGNIIWSWNAKNYYDIEPYKDISREGWTHCNAAHRLENGNTLISLRNFNLTLEISPEGSVVWSQDWISIGSADADPHDPELLSNGNLIVCLQNNSTYEVAEINRDTREIIWKYARAGLRTTRDADRLSNGNTLIVGVISPAEDSVIFEVAPAGVIVWQLKVKDTPATRIPGWFYKAERVIG